MKKIFFLLPLLISSCFLFSQSYRITVQYKPVDKAYLYLGYYFGDKKYVQDSALLQPNGQAVFTGTTSLTGGLYIIVDPEKKRFFDILIDKEQQFTVQIDTASFVISSIQGSTENSFLEEYKQATARFFSNYRNWQTELTAAKSKKDSAAIQQKMNTVINGAQQWRDSFSLAQPESYLSLLFTLMKEPVYNVTSAKTQQDSINAFYNYKKQFWQNISFADERLLRTPMFEQRLSRYMENVVYRHPDSIKTELDKFILYSRTNKTMFRYFINRFTNDYMNPKYMGLDVVFLHLFEKYYITEQVDWLEKKDKDLVYNRAYSIMGNIVGEPAAELNLLDTLDKKINLYSIKSPYTIIIFWDPDCSHCREQVPKLDSMYRSAWKKQGIKMVGVLTDTIKTDKSKMPSVKSNWTKYIREHALEGWVHLYQTPQMKEAEAKNNLPGFRQTYDVYQTPTIYLLDEQKRIIAKKINPEQVNEFLQFKQTNKTSKLP
ncbi:MAG: redoxin domain-containing protein [Chitinophagaceae bacterium]|jgi:thiol-disulfide isomerase/thioredoxin|nr:redoxin domain-containing protein [Chitinophagaceae bacterium]